MAVLTGKGLPSPFRRLDNYTFGGGRAPGAEYQLGRFGRAAESVVHTPGTAGHRADRSKSAGPRLSFTAGTAAEDVRTLAAHKTVFIAAFTQEGGVIRSNIPFMVAADGPRVGFEYESGERFGIAFIGRDGNLDYVTNKVIPAHRVYDLINNSFVSQRNMRRP